MFLLMLLPFLQAAAAGFTIWGVVHTASTTEVVVHYGVGEDGASLAELANSYGSVIIGIGGFIVSHFLNKKAGQKTEFAMALSAYMLSSDNPALKRRLALAVCDWIEDTFASNNPDSTDVNWWHQTITVLRQRFVETQSKTVIAVITPQQTSK
jgi:hypothetical protein